MLHLNWRKKVLYACWEWEALYISIDSSSSSLRTLISSFILCLVDLSHCESGGWSLHYFLFLIYILKSTSSCFKYILLCSSFSIYVDKFQVLLMHLPLSLNQCIMSIPISLSSFKPYLIWYKYDLSCLFRLPFTCEVIFQSFTLSLCLLWVKIYFL